MIVLKNCYLLAVIERFAVNNKKCPKWYTNQSRPLNWFYIRTWRLIFWSFSNIAEIVSAEMLEKFPTICLFGSPSIIKFPKSILADVFLYKYVTIKIIGYPYLKACFNLQIATTTKLEYIHTYLLFIWHTSIFKFPESILEQVNVFVHIRH